MAALEVRETIWPEGHSSIATSLKDLADLYLLWSRFERAHALLKAVRRMQVSNWGHSHAKLGETLSSLAQVSSASLTLAVFGTQKGLRCLSFCCSGTIERPVRARLRLAVHCVQAMVLGLDRA